MKERQRWQPEEDAVLRAYVKQYGAKDWNLVSQRMGKALDRDAKSCLERWKNYLKPGIKKGSLTEGEQALVICLQAKYGNKWKKIASEVPGRTAKRLGKWWEVFKEKQLKEKQKGLNLQHMPGSPADESLQSKYGHILDTFAEKYVQPKLMSQQQPLSASLMRKISLESPPILSLGAVDLPGAGSVMPLSIPPWMSVSSSVTPSSSSCTVSPSVSLTLSQSEPPASPENGHNRLLPVAHISTLVHYIKELEEGKQNWLRHKKEAAWRLSRLEQQLESEKARKRRAKIEEVEVKIKSLREEEMAFLDQLEADYREQLVSIRREAEAKDGKLLEDWGTRHDELARFLEHMRMQNHWTAPE